MLQYLGTQNSGRQWTIPFIKRAWTVKGCNQWEHHYEVLYEKWMVKSLRYILTEDGGINK